MDDPRCVEIYSFVDRRNEREVVKWRDNLCVAC